jgi:hypothetical protein
MSGHQPNPGDFVSYTLNDGDVQAINDYLPPGPLRNSVHAGDVYPAMVVRVFDPTVTTSNLQVFLDGACTYWATSRVEGDQPGTWAWPPRQPGAAVVAVDAKARASHEGLVAYEAYCAAVGGVSVRNEPLPTYDEMRERNPRVAEAWNRAGEAVGALYTTGA